MVLFDHGANQTRKIRASKVQFPGPDRKGGDKNEDHIHCSPFLTQASTKAAVQKFFNELDDFRHVYRHVPDSKK